MNCPKCQSPLTGSEVATLHAKAQSARRKTRSGGKVWKHHSIAAGSRCRCRDCNELRAHKKQEKSQ